MRQQIRKGVFETNSSTEHVISISNYLAILSNSEYEKYLKNEIIVTRYGQVLDAKDKEAKSLSTWEIVNKHDSWYDDSEITHEERVVGGRRIHVISICHAEEHEEYR